MPAGGAARCPNCRAAGKRVGGPPVWAHRPSAPAGDWQFCSTTSCPVVFFVGPETVTEDEVITRVGSKASDKPIPVCYCFAHTQADIVADLAAHDGTSTISASVRDAVAAGLCACESLNPTGKCCLPDIHRTVNARRSNPDATATDRDDVR